MKLILVVGPRRGHAHHQGANVSVFRNGEESPGPEPCWVSLGKVRRDR